MVYVVVFFLPFLGPFFRAQLVKGLWYIVCAALFFALSAGVPILFVLWPIWGIQQVSRTWSFRKTGVCVEDYLDHR